MSEYKRLVGRMRGSIGKALNKTRELVGSSNDSDLEIYTRLTDVDFKMIGDKYGQDGLVNYIKAMEHRKMRNHAT